MRHKIHMNLVLSLLLAQVLFLAGIKETSSKVKFPYFILCLLHPSIRQLNNPRHRA